MPRHRGRPLASGLALAAGLTLLALPGCSDDDGASSPDAAVTPDAAVPGDMGVPKDAAAGADAAVLPDALAKPDASVPDTASPADGSASDAAKPLADARPDATADGVPVAGKTFKIRLENVAPFTMLKSGVFSTKVGGAAPGTIPPGPLAPGDAYEIKFTAGKGHKLAFATMFGASNDWVFATAPGGFDLYDGETPISGDVTSKVALYDVGTEIDEEPAVGPHTGPNQATSTDGPGALDPNRTVRKLGASVALTAGGTFTLPPIASLIRVTVTPNAATREFTVRIENVSDDTKTLMTSQGAKPVRISPGVWALAAGTEPLFTEGMADRGQGLEEIAEGGDTTKLGAAVTPLTGLATGISPGVFAVHTAPGPLYTFGQPDRGQGLERIAEEGNVGPLADALQMAPPVGVKSTGVFSKPVGTDVAGPIGPGGAYELTVSAAPGDRLSLAVMYGWSNDWVFGTVDTGIPLFDATTGAPVQGDVTGQIRLIDVGTELSEEPAVGPNTGPQQPAPNTGPVDTDAHVREVTSATYKTPVAQHLKVTVTPQ